MLKVRIFNRLAKAHEDKFIYSKAEADEAGIAYKPWVECNKGEFGLSDDGYVTELMEHKTYSSDKNYGIWLFTGGIVKRYKNYGRKPDCDEQLIVGPLLTGERKAKKIADALNTEKARKIIRAFLLNDRKIDVAVATILPAAPMVELNKWRTVAKSEEFKKMVKEEILNVLTACGYTREKTMILLTEAIDIAREKKDVANMLRAVENLFDILGFKEKDVQKQSLEYSSHAIEHLADSILEDKRTVKATREIPFDPSAGSPEFDMNKE